MYLRRRVLLLRSLLADGPAARDGLYPYRGLFPGSHLGSSGSLDVTKLEATSAVVVDETGVGVDVDTEDASDAIVVKEEAEKLRQLRDGRLDAA